MRTFTSAVVPPPVLPVTDALPFALGVGPLVPRFDAFAPFAGLLRAFQLL